MPEDEQNNVLIIWAGQLVLFCLKCDRHDLKLLVPSLREHIFTLLKSDDNRFCKCKFSAAGKKFASLLGQRFSFAPDATEILGKRFSELAVSVISDEDCSKTILALRTADAWSGLASCASKIPVPRSLLDYILDALLPIVAAPKIPQLCRQISSLFDGSRRAFSSSLEDIEEQLQKIVSLLCFGSALDRSSSNDLELAVLLHLPKVDGLLASNTGYVYELLNQKFKHEEAR